MEAQRGSTAGDYPPVRFALTGAGGQFARTLLAQARVLSTITPTVLCDLDLDIVRGTCQELGYPAEHLQVCTSRAEVEAAVATGRIALVADSALLAAEGYDVLVEATGKVGPSYRMALAALRSGRHVAMVSKETESVVGPHLARVAAENGVVCTTAAGDQPANLIALIAWARTLGLEIVAAGKSAEYDVVHDETAGTATHLGRTIEAPDLAGLRASGTQVSATLTRRRAALAAFDLSGAADYCEMNVVANYTGLLPDEPAMHYPVLRTNELAEVYSLREHGGILAGTGVLDVFTQLRRPDEASFGGGVFIVVRCSDPVTWDVLAGKGHVVSADRRYACIYQPFHLMGVETPTTLLAAAHHGRAPQAPRQVATMVGRARRDLPAGRLLAVTGHHHEIDDVDPLLVPAPSAQAVGAAPYYLAGGTRLREDVAAGELLRLDALTDVDEALVDAWRS